MEIGYGQTMYAQEDEEDHVIQVTRSNNLSIRESQDIDDTLWVCCDNLSCST